MSGVEIIAIVSCVAGLIEALDAGVRIVRQIKARRAAHRADGALPPSDELEKTIEEGKENIQKLVEKGNHRFGPGFEEGDETAQIAILRITVQIQNVLLQRLTQARSDDGVVDFAECIDLSDQGCMDALTALQALYQRKLDETRPKVAASENIEPPKLEPQKSVEQQAAKSLEKPAAAPRVKSAPPVAQSLANAVPEPSSKFTKPAKPLRSPVIEEDPEVRPSTRRKGSKGFKFFGGGTYHSAFIEAPPSSKSSRRSTSGSLDQSPMSPQQSRGSRASVSSRTSSNPDHESMPHLWDQGMSRATTIGTLGSMDSLASTPSAEIAKYGGSCKYAFFMREHGPKGSLEAQNPSMYCDTWMLTCKSQKCKFGKQVKDAKAKDQVDPTIHSSHGIQYRWMFLAKSHCAQNVVSSNWPYVCLICQFLNHDPKKFLGHERLFEHIATHEESDIAGISLEGPLTFSNRGIKMEPDFDLMIPKREPKRPSTVSTTGARTAEELQKRLQALQIDRTSKTSSIETTRTDDDSVSATTDDLYTNVWAETD